MKHEIDYLVFSSKTRKQLNLYLGDYEFITKILFSFGVLIYNFL